MSIASAAIVPSLIVPKNNVDYNHPVLQKTNHNQSAVVRQNLSESTKEACICSLFCLFMILSLFLTIFFEAIEQTTMPQVDVDDVNLTRFILSPTNNTLYYYVAANMTFRNPYNIVGIHFDKIDADLMYQSQRLGTKKLPAFYLLPKNEKSFVNVLLRGEHVLQLINGDEKLVYESENKSGVYTIGVKVRIVMRTKVMMVNWDTVHRVIMYDNLQVSIGDHHEVLSAI